MDEVIGMKRFNIRGKTFTRLLTFLVVLSMLFPGVVYSEDTMGIYENGQDIGPGTYYRDIKYITPNGTFAVDILEADIEADNMKIEVSHGNGTIVNKPVTAQALQKNTSDRRVIGAINGDFFDMTLIKGLSYGTSIVDGEIVTAVPSSTVFGVNEDGSVFIDTLNMKGTLTFKDRTADIAMVNRLRWQNQTIVYTPTFGKTTANTVVGADIVVRGVELPLRPNKTYTGTIERIQNNSKSVEIPEDGVVISVQGSAINTFTGAVPGDSISFSITSDKPELRYAVAGSPRLIKDGKASTELGSRTDSKQRHPRTAVGIKDNKVYMVTVDGRQPGVSDGMTLYEFTELLLSQGIQDAINLDGGGSTTMAVRKQGDAAIKLVNKPSDGRERYVGNSIQIVSETPISEPAFIRFNNTGVKIYKNSSFKPTFYAMDKYYNLVKVDEEKVKYGADEKTAKISEDGIYTSGDKAAQSFLYVYYGDAKERLTVEIVDEASRILILNDFIHLDPGEEVQMEVRAFDENGSQVIISPAAVQWDIEGDIGIVDDRGVFIAGEKPGMGKIYAVMGESKSEVEAKVGRDPIIIADFGLLDNVEANVIRSTAAIRHNQENEPVKSGKISLRFDYNFENTTGTSAAYVAFKKPLKIIGKPMEIGAWVYGDKSYHWIRGNYINAQGERKVINFTENGGLDWEGWKYVYAEIPQDEKFPISFEQIYVAEPQEDRKNKGTIFIDEIFAVYKEGNDYYNPVILSYSPQNFQELETAPEQITIDVQDKGSGVDPASIEMLINGKTVDIQYDQETGKVVYIPDEVFERGKHEVRFNMKDKAGNPLNPELNFSFIVK